MLDTPLVSVVIPVYKVEPYLCRCVDSVLAQTLSDIEVILVDDGSPDGCPAICDRYAEQYPQIRVIHKENGGVSAARNDGIAAARGVWLLFLDSDDALEEGALRRYCEAAESDVDGIIGALSVWENGCEARRITASPQGVLSHEIWETIAKDPAPFGYAGGKAVRTALVKERGLTFDPSMRSQEDLDFFLCVYRYGACFRVLSETTYRYHYAPSDRVPPIHDYVRNQLKLLRLGRERPPMSPAAEEAVAKRILSLLFTALYEASEKGETAAVAATLRGAPGLMPYLETLKPKGEHGFVVRRFVKGNDRGIARYFAVRNRLRDAVRTIRGKTKTR